MSADDKIYAKIGNLLLDCAPIDAIKIIVDATLTKEGDAGEFLFDYISYSGEKKWFSVGGHITLNILHLLADLRNLFETNNLYAGRNPWSGCEIEFDLKTQKLGITFKYELYFGDQ